MKFTLDDKCTFCRPEKETIKHMFWDCESVAYFWEGLQFYLVQEIEQYVTNAPERPLY